MTKTPDKYGVKLPDGFNGSQIETIEALFEMTSHTIQHHKLFSGFTAELSRSSLGEWRYVIVPKENA